jgi:hypothetical protein
VENTLFYTFSTISQTLAGAIGLLAAFVLYYLAELNRRLRSHLQKLYSRYPAATETVDLELMWEHYDVPGLLAYFKKDHLERLSGGEGTDKALHLKPAEGLWQSRQAALARTQEALAWTAVVIVFAITMLACARLVAPYAFLSVSLLAIAVCAVAWCFWLYSRLILSAVGNSR